jgi:DNA ligase (NAD+)
MNALTDGATTPPHGSPPRPPAKPIGAMSIDELAMAVRYHNHRYFVLNAPEIDDPTFDRIVERLRSVAPDHSALGELSEGIVDETGLFEHNTPMLSLDKAYDEGGVLKWAASFAGGIVEAPKIDGIAASLHYDASGALVAAVTRGDGRRGELFTANARFIPSIPQRLPRGPAEVRGEVYMPLSVFRARFADEGFSNPRNTTAGAIKQKDPARTADYGLGFFVYSVRGTPADHAFESLSEGLAWASTQGFTVVPWRLTERAGIHAGWLAWLERRSSIDFELDGVVYSADALAEQARLGETAHHPRWAIAFKFQGESGETRIRDIEWSVSRSGAITPVAHVEPIVLSGASVSRCSLHNLAILRTLGANIGARVMAMRRGGVIPHIESVIEPGPEPVAIPTTCPVSGHPTVVTGDFLMCSAPDACGAARLGTLAHFLKVVEIEGFGPKIIARLLEGGHVAEPADFYRLTAETLANLERLGRKSAQNLVDQVQQKRVVALPVFLEALGIDDLGAVASRKVAEAFVSLEAVRSADEAAIAAIHGLGDITAGNIRKGLEERRDLIDRLLNEVRVSDHVVTATPVLERDDNDPVAGRSFVFTGKLASSDRKTAQNLVLARGGLAPDDVSKTLDYLVVGDDGSPLLGGGAKSSKQKKAEKLQTEGTPIRIISETDFRRMLGLN